MALTAAITPAVLTWLLIGPILVIGSEPQTNNFASVKLLPAKRPATNWPEVINDMLTTSTQPQIYPTPPQKNYFSKLGYVEPTRDWLHFHVTYNFTSLKAFASVPCNCLATAKRFYATDGVGDKRHMRTNIYLHHSVNSFDKQCAKAKTLTNNFDTLIREATLYSNAPGHNDHRQERGIPALLWTSVAASVGPTGFSLAKYILQHVSKASFIFNIASTLVSVLSFGTYLINGRTSTYTESKLHDWDAYDMEAKLRNCQRDTDALFRYITNFDAGILQLLRHEYPSNFLHPSSILAELPKLRQALSDKEIRLLLDNPADIALSPSSFVVQDNTIHMFIHIPISHAPRLTAYRYIPTPTVYELTNITTLATITHPHEVLALTDNMDTFVELPNLNDCTEMQGNKFLCPNTPVLHHNADGSCLFALFTSNTENTYKYCTLNHFQRKYFAAELAPTRFFLYTQNPRKAHIKCAAPTNLKLDQPFQTRKTETSALSRTLPLHYTSSVIQLPPHCHLRIFNLSLYPASHHKTDVILAKSAFTHNEAKFFEMNQILHSGTEELATPNNKESHMSIITRYMPHIIAIFCLLIAVILSIIIISIPLFCVKRRNGRFVIKQPLRDLLLCLHSRPGPLQPLQHSVIRQSPVHYHAPPNEAPQPAQQATPAVLITPATPAPTRAPEPVTPNNSPVRTQQPLPARLASSNNDNTAYPMLPMPVGGGEVRIMNNNQ